MSAWIMSPKGFNFLANEMIYHALDVKSPFNETFAHLLGHEEKFYLDHAQLIVKEWQKANIEAVSQRYSEENQIPKIPFFYAYRPYNWTPEQLIKNLACLRYQMSEGDVPESKTYKQLDQLIGSLAYSLLDNTPAYSQANWGWDG